ncbi:MAG: Asp23/Gls24 family envelope stress response protein [Oscillospiraceae bacterium]|nr:Asp23/Gls24 family envelope stress response protein [Oscillospiraceae bacterium]
MVKTSNEHGTIGIARDVFTILTGEAATNCFGVKGMTRYSVTDGLVHLLKREAMGKGVHITYNDDNSISISLSIAVDQGVNIPVACESIADQVRYKVQKGTGVEVKRVDIYIDSMILG